MNEEYQQFVIRGVTADGNRFRPSDWAERLCASLASFDAHGRIRRSPHVKIQVTDGEKRLLVNTRIAGENRDGFAFVQRFAQDNGMQTETRSA